MSIKLLWDCICDWLSCELNIGHDVILICDVVVVTALASVVTVVTTGNVVGWLFWLVCEICLKLEVIDTDLDNWSLSLSPSLSSFSTEMTFGKLGHDLDLDFLNLSCLCISIVLVAVRLLKRILLTLFMNCATDSAVKCTDDWELLWLCVISETSSSGAESAKIQISQLINFQIAPSFSSAGYKPSKRRVRCIARWIKYIIHP